MPLLLLILVSLLFASVSGVKQSRRRHVDAECPTGFIPKVSHGSVSCVCGDPGSEIVVCHQSSNSTRLLYDNCMTYDEKTNNTLFGQCPFTSREPDRRSLYVKLPKNVDDLNDFMCGGLNRTGLLCGQCQPGLGPAMISYSLQCLQCWDNGSGWLLYLFLATFPTTLLFFIIVFCHFRITSAPMNAFIFACQVLISTFNLNPHVYMDLSGSLQNLTLTMLTLFGMWNLDFFRYVIPQFCVSSKLSNIQAISLEYIIAFYPLVLFMVSYACIQLHARGCQVLVFLVRPFHKCCGSFDSRFHPGESLIHSFAAFLLLAYAKIFIVSCKLLRPNPVYNTHGSRVGPLALLYEPSVSFFSTEHLPYAILAISVIAICIVSSLLLLLLYTTRPFQHCLNCFRVRGHALHAFVDVFQGYYKDGTAGTRDWRCFSGLYLLIRIVAIGSHLLPGTTQLRYVSYAIMSLLFALLRPYKKNWFNVLDSITFSLFAFGELTIIYDEHVSKTRPFLAYILAMLPVVYIVVYTTYKLLHRIGVFQYCSRFRNLNSEDIPRVSEQRSDSTVTADYPDRVVHPEKYEQTEGEKSCSEVSLLMEKSTTTAFNTPGYGSV